MYCVALRRCINRLSVLILHVGISIYGETPLAAAFPNPVNYEIHTQVWVGVAGSGREQRTSPVIPPKQLELVHNR